VYVLNTTIAQNTFILITVILSIIMCESRRYRREPLLRPLMPSVSADIDGFSEFGEYVSMRAS